MKIIVSAIADVIPGYAFRSRVTPQPDGNVRVIQMKDIDDRDALQTADLVRTHLSGADQHLRVQEGDLIFRARGLFHTAAIAPAHITDAIVAAPLMLVRVTDRRVTPSYVRWYINHPKTQVTLSNLAAGSYVRSITKASLATLEVALPPLDAQKRIVEIAILGEREHALMKGISEKRTRLLDEILARFARNTR